MKKNKFLTAEWKKLIMANYVADQALFQKYLPGKTELDRWNGQCFISLVGFMFQNTRVMGLKIPGHINFPEVNLRFYVRYKDKFIWKRGVVFLSEIVPKRAISLVANTFFHEQYTTLPMKHRWQEEADQLCVGYYWKKNYQWNSLEVNTGRLPVPLAAGSPEEFITEHFWGYSRISEHQTAEYQVEHPRWAIYPVRDYRVECDFSKLYGKQFEFMKDTRPASVFLAEGSAVTVFQKQVIEVSSSPGF